MKIPRTCFFLAAIIVLLPAGIINASDSCVHCHGNEVRMKELGYSQFLVTAENSTAQTGMTAACVDCHLGDAEAQAIQDSHRGLLSLRVVGKKWNTQERAGMKEQDLKNWPSLEPRGDKKASQLGPKMLIDGTLADNPDFRTILYHDKNPATLAFNPGIAENTCGKCHPKQREEYAKSVHGKAVLEDKNQYAAVCSDCHSTHDVESPAKTSAKLAIVQNCGTCHAESLKTYTGTYHGQVGTLGYAYTAKCYDCHGSHGIQRVSDPNSNVHPDNRLNTCQKCHKDATQGFVTFEPHATTHDFKRYPQVWLTSKFMIALLAGVFLFFWSHTALWFYREYRERQERKSRPHVLTDDTLAPQGKQFQRFGPVWRLAHLVFAMSVMTLVLTGMAVFFGETAFAKVVIAAFGSPKAAARSATLGTCICWSIGTEMA